jgi:AcrR family transcriptional regulator
MPTPTARRPQQARSRTTERRLLDAVEVVLERYGADGVTVARVARQAQLSPASVYRRFRDKNDLLAAVFARFGEINRQELERKIDTEQLRLMGIRTFTQNWIHSMIQGFRTRTGLIRASVLYAQQHPQVAFVRRKAEVETELFGKMVDLFLLWRDEIRHPNPAEAVRFAMVSVALVLRELIIFGHAPMFERLTPVSDDRLREELPQLFLRYLGIEGD